MKCNYDILELDFETVKRAAKLYNSISNVEKKNFCKVRLNGNLINHIYVPLMHIRYDPKNRIELDTFNNRREQIIDIIDKLSKFNYKLNAMGFDSLIYFVDYDCGIKVNLVGITNVKNNIDILKVPSIVTKIVIDKSFYKVNKIILPNRFSILITCNTKNIAFEGIGNATNALIINDSTPIITEENIYFKHLKNHTLDLKSFNKTKTIEFGEDCTLDYLYIPSEIEIDKIRLNNNINNLTTDNKMLLVFGHNIITVETPLDTIKIDDKICSTVGNKLINGYIKLVKM